MRGGFLLHLIAINSRHLTQLDSLSKKLLLRGAKSLSKNNQPFHTLLDFSFFLSFPFFFAIMVIDAGGFEFHQFIDLPSLCAGDCLPAGRRRAGGGGGRKQPGPHCVIKISSDAFYKFLYQLLKKKKKKERTNSPPGCLLLPCRYPCTPPHLHPGEVCSS